MSKTLKYTPTHCDLLLCRRFWFAPGENASECVGCPGLKDRTWKPSAAGGGHGGENSAGTKEAEP